MTAPAGKALRIGIWIELPPGARWRTEGIGRLIGYIINGTAPAGVRFVLCAPPWMERELQLFRGELDPSAQPHVEFRTAPSSALRWHAALGARGREGRKARPAGWLSTWLAQLRAQPSYFGIAAGVVLITAMWLMRLLNPVRWTRNVLKKTQAVEKLRRRLAATSLAELVSANTLVKAEITANIAYANAMKDIDVWVTPYPGFAGSSTFKRPNVLIFPDYVIADYPEGFDIAARQIVEALFHKSVAAADRIISFSDDVRTRHVVRTFAAPLEKTAVIPHCLMNIASSWTGPPTVPRTAQSRAHAAALIRQYAREQLAANRDVPEGGLWAALAGAADFSELQFVFCPQQARPYKNLPRLVELMVELNRRRSTPVHLVISAFVDLRRSDDPFTACVNVLGAWEYITIAPSLPADVHAAFYHAAALAIHPSYFEGGLSFIFGEAVSMGTPCLLSKNAANMESLDPDEFDYMLFDPSSLQELADKAQAALSNRDAFLERQRAHMDQVLSKRNWAVVAQEYLQVFEAARR